MFYHLSMWLLISEMKSIFFLQNIKTWVVDIASRVVTPRATLAGTCTIWGFAQNWTSWHIFWNKSWCDQDQVKASFSHRFVVKPERHPANRDGHDAGNIHLRKICHWHREPTPGGNICHWYREYTPGGVSIGIKWSHGGIWWIYNHKFTTTHRSKRDAKPIEIFIVVKPMKKENNWYWPWQWRRRAAWRKWGWLEGTNTRLQTKYVNQYILCCVLHSLWTK